MRGVMTCLCVRLPLIVKLKISNNYHNSVLMAFKMCWYLFMYLQLVYYLVVESKAVLVSNWPKDMMPKFIYLQHDWIYKHTSIGVNLVFLIKEILIRSAALTLFRGLMTHSSFNGQGHSCFRAWFCSCSSPNHYLIQWWLIVIVITYLVHSRTDLNELWIEDLRTFVWQLRLQNIYDFVGAQIY